MVRRIAVMLACLLWGGLASAGSARVRWRGVVVEGKTPAGLQAAVTSHVAVALRSLGSSLVTSGPEDAEAAASCAFPSTARVARCVVVVKVGKGAKAERRAEIRYRDGEDLAESLALLVSDILTSEFPDIVGGVHAAPPTENPNPPTPTPTPTPTTPTPTPAKTPEQVAAEQKAHEVEMQRQLEVVKTLQKQADEQREKREKERVVPVVVPKLPPVTRVAVEVGADGVFGLGPANPTLVGGAARVMYARAILRAGASVSLTGMRQTLDGHDLSFFRALVGARAGIGFRTATVDFDLSAGPGLLVLVEDAHAEGRHAIASLAFVGGPRLAVTLSGPIAIVAGADFDLAVTDEKVTAGGARVAQFSRASVEVTLGIAWRSR